MKKQAGFTLIELVMVIVILGILAAVALPKFVNLGADARTAAMKGVQGSMRTANAMIYAKAAMANKMGATASLTTTDFPGAPSAIDLIYGYASTAAELAKAMDLSPDFDTTVSMEIQHKGAQNPGACGITYTVAALNVAPTYPLESSGC